MSRSGAVQSTFKRGLAATPEERALVKRVHAAMRTAGDITGLMVLDDIGNLARFLSPHELFEPGPTRDWLLAFAKALGEGTDG